MQNERAIANQLALKRQNERRSSQANSDHIRGQTANLAPNGLQGSLASHQNTQGQESGHGGSQQTPSGVSGTEESEQRNANTLAGIRARQNGEDTKKKKKGKEQKKTNQSGSMIYVGLVFCFIRDVVWIFFALIGIIPGVGQFFWGGLVIIDVLAILPFFADKRFVTFVLKEVLGIRKPKGKGAELLEQVAKKTAKMAAKKVGVALGEIIIPIIIFMPGYIIAAWIIRGMYEKAPIEDSQILPSTPSTSQGGGNQGNKKQNQQKAKLSAAYAKK